MVETPWLTIDHVTDRTTLSPAEIDGRVADGSFPQPVVTAGRSGWRESDIDHWIETRPVVAEFVRPATVH
jgi:predicted DNA-binding transcriptional regulator AlpA